jgi:hypothetical protein
MKRWFLFLPIVFFPVLALAAQDIDTEEPETPGIFSVALILEKAEVPAQGVWQPDWPFELPLDAFSAGDFYRCSLEGEGYSISYRLGVEGRLEEFPFMLKGGIVQVRFFYRGLSGHEIREISLVSPSGEALWNLEILEYRNSYPYIVRGTNGEAWFFIYFSRGINDIYETWYDQEGVYLGAYALSLAETGKNFRTWAVREYSNPLSIEVTEYFYDSRLFITEILSFSGFYKVFYYRENLPRYWERLPRTGETEISTGLFYLQWDEGGFLARISCLTEPGEGGFAESRYEYTLDERGNWIERREIRMIRQLGLLVPTQGTVYKRVLGYGE